MVKTVESPGMLINPLSRQLEQYFEILWFSIVCLRCSDDDDAIQEENLEFDSGFGNIIVVDNLPVVPKEKFEKLVTVVRKIYSQIGAIKEDGLWMPVDPATEKSLGYCFIEYNTPQVNKWSFFYVEFNVCFTIGVMRLNCNGYCRKLSLLRRRLKDTNWIVPIYFLWVCSMILIGSWKCQTSGLLLHTRNMLQG